MNQIIFLCTLSFIFLAGSPIIGNAQPTFPANLVDNLQIDSVDARYVIGWSIAPATEQEFNKTYMASNAIPANNEEELKDNTPSKIKAGQIKVVPSIGSYQGGCTSDGYTIEISGANFGSGWDINSVTICCVEVCNIILQSSNLVVVYPNTGIPGTGDIVINSKSLGKTTIKNGFTYQVTVPKNQARNIQYSNIEPTSTDISWSRGSGESCVVFFKEASSGLSTPVDRTTYNSGIIFGDGTQVGSTGWYCVYNGKGSSVTVAGLVPGANYITQVFEYNGQAGFETFLTSPTTDNPKMQETIASTNRVNSNSFSKNISVSLDNAGNDKSRK